MRVSRSRCILTNQLAQPPGELNKQPAARTVPLLCPPAPLGSPGELSQPRALGPQLFPQGICPPSRFELGLHRNQEIWLSETSFSLPAAPSSTHTAPHHVPGAVSDIPGSSCRTPVHTHAQTLCVGQALPPAPQPHQRDSLATAERIRSALRPVQCTAPADAQHRPAPRTHPAPRAPAETSWNRGQILTAVSPRPSALSQTAPAMRSREAR